MKINKFIKEKFNIVKEFCSRLVDKFFAFFKCNSNFIVVLFTNLYCSLWIALLFLIPIWALINLLLYINGVNYDFTLFSSFVLTYIIAICKNLPKITLK